MDIRMRTLVSN